MGEIVRSEHRAIVFKMNRKQAAAVARYLKDHSASPETAFAVDVDTLELIIQAKTAREDDILVLDGAEDVFEVEEEMVEENEEVWEPVEDGDQDDAEEEDLGDKVEALAEAIEDKVEAFADSAAAKLGAAVDKVKDLIDGEDK